MNAHTRLLVFPLVALCLGAGVTTAPGPLESTVAVRGMVTGGTDVLDAPKLTRVATLLGATFGRSSERVAMRLRQLDTAPGAGLYLEVKQSGATRPEVVLEPGAGATAALLVNGEMAVDLPTDAAELGNALAVFWIQDGTQDRYRVRVPAGVRHVTLVINGRLVSAVRPFDHAAAPTTLR